MPSLPSKTVLQDAFPQLSLGKIETLWESMVDAARVLVDPNLSDQEALNEGHNVLTMAAVLLNNGSSVRDTGVYGGWPVQPLAIYVDAGVDMPTLMYMPDTRCFEVKRYKQWLTNIMNYMDSLTDYEENHNGV